MAQQIAIVGAGLAGPLLACFLSRDGFDVTLYERRSDPRIAGFVGGRSINLALSARGIDALQRIGLAAEVLKSVIPMHGRMLHEPSGKLAFQYYSSNHNDAINSVSRGDLNIKLLNAAEKCGAKVIFERRCVNLDLNAVKPIIAFDNGLTATADIVIGADGAYSAARLSMQMREGFNYQQDYEEHGYKELTIPPSKTGDFAMEENALHIWPRGQYMMIALPNQDKSFTCTCFWPNEMFASLKTPAQIEDFFKQEFSDAVPLMPKLVEDFQRNPVGALVTIKCRPWSFENKVVLLGDSAHAIVPFYGQGMNAAFEDCVTFSQCAKQFAPDWMRVFAEYESQRKQNTDAIADMALDNFIEMRDHTASGWFLLKKKLSHLLHKLFPSAFIPLYNMVSFSTIPYAEAQKRAREQARKIRLVATGFAILIIIILFFVLR